MAKVFLLPPKKCSICNETLTTVFYDAVMAREHSGSWAFMCPNCNKKWGATRGDDERLATDVGQKYEKQPNGDWHKVK